MVSRDHPHAKARGLHNGRTHRGADLSPLPTALGYDSRFTSGCPSGGCYLFSEIPSINRLTFVYDYSDSLSFSCLVVSSALKSSLSLSINFCRFSLSFLNSSMYFSNPLHTFFQSITGSTSTYSPSLCKS